MTLRDSSSTAVKSIQKRHFAWTISLKIAVEASKISPNESNTSQPVMLNGGWRRNALPLWNSIFSSLSLRTTHTSSSRLCRRHLVLFSQYNRLRHDAMALAVLWRCSDDPHPISLRPTLYKVQSARGRVVGAVGSST